MGLSSILEWWYESQLRVLVLAGLFLQYILAIFSGGRRFIVPNWYRFLIWLTLLGSDAIAIYALATLFNRQSKQQRTSPNGSRDLQVLWAPILLMHLGGQVFITAYNIEDNELWRRHIVTTVSQVTVAIYVFSISWSPSADKRLLAAATFLFLVGVAKCLEKTLALRGASFNSLARRDEPHKARRTPTRDREEELEEYVQNARDFVQANHPPQIKQCSIQQIAPPFLTRKSFFLLDDKTACVLLRRGLMGIFHLIYTRDPGPGPKYKSSFVCTSHTWMLTVLMSIVVISLFHSSQKKAYSHSDIAISIILLYGTFALDIFSGLALPLISVMGDSYPDVVSQHNLIGFCASKNRWMEPSRSSADITSSVREYVLSGWKEYIRDAESYRKFNEMRGQLKLESEGWDEHLGWSIQRPFDESILLWHIATVFCSHHKDTPTDCATRSTEISNYMMHLLFENTDMLMPGSRKNLFKTACNQLKGIVKDDSPLDKKKLIEETINRVKSKEAGTTDTFICDAWELAEGLMGIGDETHMWKVIQGVWIEMLCFSASRCRGYLHAKSLGSGGEYLSYVSLLLAYAGMETFAERLHRTNKLRSSKVKSKRLENQREEV
ncbi:unnamed protein product [Alopecurus aequalis]